MVNQSLTEYVKRNLARGYKPEQIRNALIKAGHSPQEVDIILRISSKIPKKTTNKIIIIALILVLLILGILFFLILSPEEKSPALKLSLTNTELQKGESLITKIQIINPSEKTTNAIINYIIFSSEGNMLTSKKKIMKIEEYIIEITEQIPIQYQTGNYRLVVTLTMGTYTLTKEINFQILIKAQTEQPKITSPEEQRDEIEKKCIGECDDYDVCTKDICIDGKCNHETITPCCGNMICENGENKTCIDCVAEEMKNKKEPVLEKTKNTKSADLTVNQCEKIITIINKDDCLYNAAKDYEISNICSKITEETKKDSCYMHFAMNGDFRVCEKINNKYTQNSCFQLEKMNELI